MILTSLLLTAAWLAAVPVVLAGEHPRLFVTFGDLPRLRQACGLDTPGANPQGMGKAGRHAKDYQALRLRLATEFGEFVLPGEVAASAFLHLADPLDPHDASRLGLIEDSLTKPSLLGPDPLELVLALDWCWYDLKPDARHEFIRRMSENAHLLTDSDSPLDHRTFREALATLALALVVDEEDEPATAWAGLRGRILNEARRYFATTFPTFVQWRGRIPTGPAHAADEESDAALAVELASLLTGEDQWPKYRDTVGRWLEHYVMETVPHPALQHQFLRDDAGDAPLTPAAQWRGMQPLTAHLIARRTRDPAAATVATSVEGRLTSLDDPSAVLWRWAPIVFDLDGIGPCDLSRLPRSRNLDGAVVLRGESGPQTAAIWIDTGQIFLRDGQHFDAGSFLIHAGGHLVVEGGEDITLEAIAAKGGCQRLGNESDTISFDQYTTATIAHNSMVFWDAARVPRWHGRRYYPNGGQRPQEGTCTDFVKSPDEQQWRPGRLVAYGSHDADAYVAVDVTPGYDKRTVSNYTREYVLLGGRALLIVDRAKLFDSRITSTWVLNVPNEPTVGGQPLVTQFKTQGEQADAGVWEIDSSGWVRWIEHSGSLALAALLPQPRIMNVVGGPAKRMTIPEGRHRGRPYVGGSADSFERLVIPSGRPNAMNAWFELGEPTLLGPQFAARPHWGRVEIELDARATEQMYLTLLVLGAVDEAPPPMPTLQRVGEDWSVTIDLDGESTTVRLPADQRLGGVIERRAADGNWVLPSEVTEDADLPAQ